MADRRLKSSCILPSSISYWLWVSAFSLLFFFGHCSNLGCQEVKKAYKARGFDETDVPIQAISGEHLEICPQGFTCCTKDMEERLNSQSQKEYDVALQESIGLVQGIFASRTSKFDEFFSELLENSKRDMHEMFVRTYGLLYQQNSQVFMDLFSDLRGYYKGRDVNLNEALDSFFVKLLKRMFELLNAQFKFSESYLNCVVKHMSKLQPFGDVPTKLKKQVQRAFVAARTFVQGLAIGRDVVVAVSEIPPTQGCQRALMKMLYCPHCRGLTDTKPCNNFCLNTLKGCLAYHAELNKAWNEYIEALMMLANRLEGPFNIESVVDPIDVKISDAIMNFQEHGLDVSRKIFAGCGEPEIGRKKRDIDSEANMDKRSTKPVAETGTDKKDKGKTSDSTNYDDYSYHFGPKKTDHVRPTTAAGTSLDRLVRDIKAKVEDVRDVWIELPYNVCNNEELAAQPGQDENSCWNGQDKARYVPDVQKDGVINQVNNPEVDVDINKSNMMIAVQIQQLKLITNKLHNAYSGYEVEWVDIELEASGSGSGSGSGQYGEQPIVVPGTVTRTTQPYYFVSSNSPTYKTRQPKPSTVRYYTDYPSAAESLRTVYSAGLITLWTLCILLVQRIAAHCV